MVSTEKASSNTQNSDPGLFFLFFPDSCGVSWQQVNTQLNVSAQGYVVSTTHISILKMKMSDFLQSVEIRHDF